jgi:hypothetical protein
MQQLGYEDPKMTLGLYARALRSKRRRAHVAEPDEVASSISAPSREMSARPSRLTPRSVRVLS